ncbi:hypothetical protein H2201_008474 [Coniosporium apollinis]|uniref:F-box domain-containing protein n=1 Tax=Coniosporium apollinis TaxID=61459 RepID=A0ABQ9NGM8_9PEZI|nr:hypothetical protein H2201_008474 [Coniosporium apollinis]
MAESKAKQAATESSAATIPSGNANLANPILGGRVATKRRYTAAHSQGNTDDDLTADVADPSAVNANSDRRRSKKRKASMSSSTPPCEPKHFPFLQLPAELRNDVYDRCLTHSDIALDCITRGVCSRARIANQWDTDEHRWRIPGLSTSLLVVSKQVLHEAAPRLHRQELSFKDLKALYCFLAGIGVNSRLVKSVTLQGLDWSWVVAHAAFTSLAGCVNLERLCLNCNIVRLSDNGHHEKSTARQFYGEVRNWLEAVGRSEDNKCAAVNLIRFSPRALRRFERIVQAQRLIDGRPSPTPAGVQGF